MRSSHPSGSRRACAPRRASRPSGLARTPAPSAAADAASSYLLTLDLAGLLGLLQNQLAKDVFGNADAARLGEGFRILLRQHRAPHAGARRIAERAFALEAVGHLREHLVDKHRLEIGRGGLGLS